MLRLMGAALLTAGSAALGLGAVGRLEGRVRDLSGLEAGLGTLERELGWRLAPLAEALSLVADSAGGRSARFFRLCAQAAGQPGSRPFRENWAAAIDTAQLRLEREDVEALERLGTVLGRYDGGSQRQALEAARERLADLRAAAEERRARLGRVYGALGVAAGLSLAILLL